MKRGSLNRNEDLQHTRTHPGTFLFADKHERLCEEVQITASETLLPSNVQY